MSKNALRWIAVGVFVLSSSLNYLDRQLLAALAPTIKSEFQLSNTQYGEIVSVFSIVYAAMAPAAGWFIDRVASTWAS
jgi:ACS family hexuronate transporter-like MFS transporter